MAELTMKGCVQKCVQAEHEPFLSFFFFFFFTSGCSFTLKFHANNTDITCKVMLEVKKKVSSNQYQIGTSCLGCKMADKLFLCHNANLIFREPINMCHFLKQLRCAISIYFIIYRKQVEQIKLKAEKLLFKFEFKKAYNSQCPTSWKLCNKIEKNTQI